VYLSLFLAAFLPVFVVHQQELVRRVMLAYLSAWLVAYAVFLLYPTAAPIRDEAVGEGLGAVVLRATWGADVPYNCFPSLHVAQCFLAAFSCNKVHRGVGAAAFVWASLVGLSTLHTKQHYVVDVLAGVLLAVAAYAVFMHSYPRDATPEAERRLAPLLAFGAVAVYGIIALVFWILYAVRFLS
jgi:membrane-associated phospholipid phosphatase